MGKQGPANVFCQEPVSDFTGLVVSLATTQICCSQVKTAIDRMSGNRPSYVPTKLYLQKPVLGRIGPRGAVVDN